MKQVNMKKPNHAVIVDWISTLLIHYPEYSKFCHKENSLQVLLYKNFYFGLILVNFKG